MVRQPIDFHGRVHIKAWELQPDGTEKLIMDKINDNLIVNVGKDSILKYLGNITGGGYSYAIGTGDSTTVADASQTDLQASTNKLWKNINASDRVYSRPTLYISSEFGYSEANWTWNELGLRDNNAVMWARQVDGSPLVKTSTKRALVEWQISL